MAEFLIQILPFWIQGIFARWPNNPNIEGLIQAQKITHFLIAIGKHVKYLFLKFVFRYLLVPVGLHKVYTIVVHLKAFKQASSVNKWLYVHGRKEWESYYARENLEKQKLFFEYYLKRGQRLERYPNCDL